MKLRQIISAALITTLLPLSLGTTAFGADTSDDESFEIGMTKVKITENGGLVNFDYGSSDIGLLKTENSGIKLRASAISSYNTDLDNLNNVTEPKDQSTLGACWAFSATSCLETLYMKALNESNPDLSELHPALAMSKKFLNNGAGYTGRSYADGGSCEIYAMYSTRAEDVDGLTFNGPVREEQLPYTTDANEIEGYDAEAMGNKSSGEYFPGSFSFVDLTGETLSTEQIEARNKIIKEFVNNNGSASISVYSGAASTVSYDNFKEANGYTMFYQTSPGGANHAVTVVGYDDSFAAGNFSAAGFEEPAIDGAFIVKNSWGTDWGKNGGYFYMSYASYLDRIYAFGDLTARNTYDNEYDYTPYIAAGGVGYTSSVTGNHVGAYANHFEKQSEGKEKINKISVYVQAANTTLKLYVDSDDTDDSNGSFSDFQLVEAESSENSAYTVNEDGSITVPYAGNYVFDLAEPVEIENGFTVAVYGETADSEKFPVAFEMTYGSYVKHKYSGNSYMASSISRTFKEALELTGSEVDFMIRAYTEDVSEEVTVNVTVDGTAYEADYGTALSELLSDNNISEAVYEAVSGEKNTYRAVDTSMSLTNDITLYTGSCISAPTIEMNNYQSIENENIIRFVGEITDNFETDLSGVDEITALGFVYSTDGGDTTVKIECADLYEELKAYSSPGSDVYLFKSEELEAGSYTVSAYISYSLTGSDDIITVYTAEKTISVS